ncbi:cytochrome P450 monooxygenase CYP63 [Crucibulum laeve]|uniref:Cytochrome P450 monooxygenase CYP63 n=1 Tax=Crucibulum laeve TaxID=68775 RepID=A0A5C3M2D6_9AGAR|nr:cytochrome P450 monooxygenase CYP63 [Crucibulum laeve]
MNPALYRIRLLCDLCRTFLIPAIFFALALQLTRWQLGYFTLPGYFGFIVAWTVLKGWYFQYRQDKQIRSLGARPIPRLVGKWPGNIDILLKMMTAFKTSYVLDVYLQLFEEYQCTTLNTRILWIDNIISMDQEHSKFILATGFNHFWRGTYQKERMETFLGQGIFNRDDDMWRQHRMTARPFFARDRISDCENFEKHCARTLRILSSLEANDEPCEAQDLYSRFTLDAASEFLFGQDLETLAAELPIPGKTEMGPKGSATEDTWGAFAKAFELSQQNITRRGRIGNLWPLFELFEDKNEKPSKVVREWLNPLVRQALEEKARAEKAGICSPVTEKTFLQHLADSTDDPVLICDQLLSMLLASRDTTACSLTYITYFLATEPGVAERLRAEVLEHCGSQGIPSFEQLKNLRYMRAVINETLRLFPPVPLNVRETRSSPCVLPYSDPTYYDASYDSRPLYMPANTTIVYLPLLTQRNPALWGHDAHAFDPERWLQPERIARFVANPAMFTPFSAGPRICIGQNYAYTQMSYFLVRLLQKFDKFTLAPEFQPEGSLPPVEWKERRGRQSFECVWPAAALTLYVKGGMWVRFRKAKG